MVSVLDHVTSGKSSKHAGLCSSRAYLCSIFPQRHLLISRFLFLFNQFRSHKFHLSEAYLQLLRYVASLSYMSLLLVLHAKLVFNFPPNLPWLLLLFSRVVLVRNPPCSQILQSHAIWPANEFRANLTLYIYIYISQVSTKLIFWSTSASKVYCPLSSTYFEWRALFVSDGVMKIEVLQILFSNHGEYWFLPCPRMIRVSFALPRLNSQPDLTFGYQSTWNQSPHVVLTVTADTPFTDCWMRFLLISHHFLVLGETWIKITDCSGYH